MSSDPSLLQGQGVADDKKHHDIHEPIAEGDLPTRVPRFWMAEFFLVETIHGLPTDLLVHLFTHLFVCVYTNDILLPKSYYSIYIYTYFITYAVYTYIEDHGGCVDIHVHGQFSFRPRS